MAGRKRGVKTPRLEVPLPPFKMSQQWGSLVSLAQHVVDMCAKNDLAVGKALLQLVAREASRNVQWWDNSEDYVRENMTKMIKAITPLLVGGDLEDTCDKIMGILVARKELQKLRDTLQKVPVDEEYIKTHLDDPDEEAAADAAAAAAAAATASLAGAADPYALLQQRDEDVLKRLAAVEKQLKDVEKQLKDEQAAKKVLSETVEKLAKRVREED